MEKHFTLIVAPPAHGKTRALLKLFQQIRGKWIFISPLRALAEEFYEKIQGHSPHLILRSFKDRAPCLQALRSQSHLVIISTPELFPIEFLSEMESDTYVVFDEFHLFFYWSETFRPQLWHFFVQAVPLFSLSIGLTATMSEEHLLLTRQNLHLAVDQIHLYDQGNRTLKNWPTLWRYFPSWSLGTSGLFEKLLLHELQTKKAGTILYFCAYRLQVLKLKERFQRKGFLTLGCVGGEVMAFREQLQQTPHPQVIFATTVLSHGVNLPSIGHIFISYPVKNLDFWVQMVGRGGRQGESFALTSQDPFFLSRWALSKQVLASFMTRFWYGFLGLFHRF